MSNSEQAGKHGNATQAGGSSDEPVTPESVLAFWFRDGNDALWFDVSPAFDDEIRRRFEGTVLAAQGGRLAHWQESAAGALALIVVLDQFPRNLYRGTPRAYAGDARALEVAERAMASGFDRDVPGRMRQFFYLPFQHDENLENQERSVALFQRLRDEASDMTPGELQEHVEYALRYREIIRRFGRFPHRNAILGRPSSADELSFLQP